MCGTFPPARTPDLPAFRGSILGAPGDAYLTAMCGKSPTEEYAFPNERLKSCRVHNCSGHSSLLDVALTSRVYDRRLDHKRMQAP
jgi:hypothetical protein